MDLQENLVHTYPTKNSTKMVCVYEVFPGTAIIYNNVKESQHHCEGGSWVVHMCHCAA